MKVCPSCGSQDLEEIGYSGVSGYHAQGQVHASSGFSSSGFSSIQLGTNISGMPSPKVYPTEYRCRKCNWTGKEDKLMDDFKFEIKRILKEQGVEIPSVKVEKKEDQVVDMPVIQTQEEPKADFKKLMNKIADSVFGEKVKRE